MQTKSFAHLALVTLFALIMMISCATGRPIEPLTQKSHEHVVVEKKDDTIPMDWRLRLPESLRGKTLNELVDILTLISNGAGRPIGVSPTKSAEQLVVEKKDDTIPMDWRSRLPESLRGMTFIELIEYATQHTKAWHSTESDPAGNLGKSFNCKCPGCSKEHNVASCSACCAGGGPCMGC